MALRNIQSLLVCGCALSVAIICFLKFGAASDATTSAPKQRETSTLEGKPCCGQDGQKKDANRAVDANLWVCPVFPYMNHGNYTSYYAILHDESIPGCSSSLNYDGPPNLPRGNCQNKQNCIGPFSLAALDRQKPAIHEAHQDLKDRGIPVNAQPTNDPINGAYLLDSDVKVIEFTKNPNGGPTFTAQVVLAAAQPATGSQPAIIVGLGQVIANGDANRRASAGEVVTLSRPTNSHIARVLVWMRGSEWREFQIVLREGQGRG